MIAIRHCFLLIAAACLALLLTALYMQHAMGLNPCYLCIVQRVFVIATGVTAFAAYLHSPGPKGQRIYALLTALTAFVGSGFSIRQLWLQSLPKELVPACGPPVDYLFDAFSLAEALPMLLRGDGNCAEVQWTLLGLSIPAWMLLAFVAMGVFALYQALRR